MQTNLFWIKLDNVNWLVSSTSLIRLEPNAFIRGMNSIFTTIRCYSLFEIILASVFLLSVMFSDKHIYSRFAYFIDFPDVTSDFSDTEFMDKSTEILKRFDFIFRSLP